MKIPKHIKIYKINNYDGLDRICGVYTFINKNEDVIYIGASSDIRERIIGHISYLKKKSDRCNKKLLRAWHNNEIISVGLLEKCETSLEAEQKESYYIKSWPTELYNVIKHGEIILLNENIDRFWPKVNIKGKDECWEWTGCTNYGYGIIRVNGIKYMAHRISYKIAHPDFDLSGIIRHKCNNRKCVNPYHLEIGSTQDNSRDQNCVKKHKAFGEEKFLKEWVDDKRCKIKYKALSGRLSKGWDLEIAMTTNRIKPINITAFEEEKSISEWADDDRCNVGREALRKRLKIMKPEEAITKLPQPGLKL